MQRDFDNGTTEDRTEEKILALLLLLFLMGSDYDDESDLTQDDRRALDEMYAVVRGAMGGIMERYDSGADMGPTIERIGGYLTGVYYYAFMANGMESGEEYSWELGDAEHCSDCSAQAAKGPRPASHWAEMAGGGIYPGSPSLECSGLHCKCEMVAA